MRRDWSWRESIQSIGSVVRRLVRYALLVTLFGALLVAIVVGLGVVSVPETLGDEVDHLVGELDVDRDGLSSNRERALGTDPWAWDTDGDRLGDGWEVKQRTDEGADLPGADPLRTDLYVQVSYATDVEALTETEKADLREVWAEMPVSNPDGSAGIDIHLVETALEEQPVLTTGSEMRDYQQRYYTRAYMGERQCSYHLSVVGEIAGEGIAGLGETPGRFSFVEGEYRSNILEGSVSLRVNTVTHELLHNVVGQTEFTDETGHTEGGWLSAGGDVGSTPEAEEYLSPTVADHLSEEGFAESEYYSRVRC
ncbi:hypothetical protein ACFPYI_12000 [Halomarina salina]|uniref:Uncharacterized protein n=1 Tax=Halomarina salina TaxID=1872699 RepID=A0ABD5RNN9_9EURY|nr:hypothetical protein [Halomarina salina]